MEKDRKKEMHREIVEGIHTMYEKKNKDYGSSFDESLDEFGLISSLIRLTDKRNRFKSLINGEAEVKDEKLEDTLLDMANYAIMTVMWLNIQNEDRQNPEIITSLSKLELMKSEIDEAIRGIKEVREKENREKENRYGF